MEYVFPNREFLWKCREILDLRHIIWMATDILDEMKEHESLSDMLDGKILNSLQMEVKNLIQKSH